MLTLGLGLGISSAEFTAYNGLLLRGLPVADGQGRLPLLPDQRMVDFRALWKESPCGIILRLHRKRGSRMYRGTAARYLRYSSPNTRSSACSSARIANTHPTQ